MGSEMCIRDSDRSSRCVGAFTRLMRTLPLNFQSSQRASKPQQHNSSCTANSSSASRSWLCDSCNTTTFPCVQYHRRPNHDHILTSNAKKQAQIIEPHVSYLVYRSTCVSRFELATPPGSQVTPIPMGNLVDYRALLRV